MKIGIVGTGISGLTVAHLLQHTHDLTIFEAADHAGGHTHTVDVNTGDRHLAVDTGFIVFNKKTYPHFNQLLADLKITSKPTQMSFSVKCTVTGLEYNGTNLNALFAQRRNLLRPGFWKMIRDIVRFNRALKTWLAAKPLDTSLTLGAFLQCGGYSRQLLDHYILPMGAAIWSAKPGAVGQFPLAFFGQFFDNHGFLSLNDRPQWRVIEGGSRTYVTRLLEPLRGRLRLSTPVHSVLRKPEGVLLMERSGKTHRFDQVVLAVHSDQALRVLGDPSEGEKEILSAIPYQENEVVLHTDTSLLPNKSRAWAAWNYHLLERDQGKVALTYNMNILQSLRAAETYCVTLNNSDTIDPYKIIKRMTYHHPIFTVEGIQAQQRVEEINGVNRTHFCGAWCFFGFHEDGVRSGQRVAKTLLKREVEAPA